jgi:hypothetical protein
LMCLPSRIWQNQCFSTYLVGVGTSLGARSSLRFHGGRCGGCCG